MIAVHACIAALALAWFAGDAILGLIVAPRLFVLAGEQGVGSAFAGLVFGDILSRWVVYAGLLCAIPMAVLLSILAGRSLKQVGIKAAMLPVLGIVLVLAAHGMTATTVDKGRQTAQELRENPDPARLERFRGEFHARSRMVMGFEMLTAVALAIGAIMAAHRTAGFSPRRDLISAG